MYKQTTELNESTRAYKFWTENDTIYLQQAVREELGIVDIAFNLKRSAGAIRSKAHRLNIHYFCNSNYCKYAKQAKLNRKLDLLDEHPEVSKIKKEYPYPKKRGNGKYPVRHKYEYCVPGAFHRYSNCDITASGFPNQATVARDLLNCNSEINRDEAEIFARKIIDLNDAGYFQDAWKSLSDALHHVSPCKSCESDSDFWTTASMW